MPTKTFAIEPGGPDRLSVTWHGNFKDFEVTFDEQPVGSFDDAKALKEGGTFTLSDGSTLEVKLASPMLVPELQIDRDGAPVPGSSGHPETRHRNAYQMIFFIAGFNAVIGLLGVMTGASFFRALGVGWASVATGIVYAVLAFFVKRGSVVALGLAVGLFLLDGIALIATVRPGGTPPVGGIVARFFFLLPMLRGFSALRELNDAPPPRRSTPPRPAVRPPSPRPSAPVVAAAPAGASAPAAPVPVRTLTGDAEKRRLQMTERVGPTTSGSVRKPGGATASPESVAQALRFTVHKCEITDGGLRVTAATGEARDVRWSEMGRLVVRQFPPDPPWDAAVLLDVVTLVDKARWEPVRVFVTTFVNYGALPGGASTAPARFANMTQFAEYDSNYK